MKKTRIWYWIITILFVAFMLFSAIPNILSVRESVAFMTNLGYPNYFSQFIGVAKLLGVIAVLIPGFPRIKEWAYAGLCFDLLGAFYSVAITAQSFLAGAFLFLPLAFLFASYFLYHKIQKPTLQ